MKKGVSGVIIAMLLVMISIVAVLIIYNSSRLLVKKSSSQLNTDVLTSEIELKEALFNPYSQTVEILVYRPAGYANLVGIKFVFYNDVTSWIYEERNNLPLELETKRYLIYVGTNITNIKNVSVALIVSAGGQEVVSMIKDSENVELAVLGGAGIPETNKCNVLGAGIKARIQQLEASGKVVRKEGENVKPGEYFIVPSNNSDNANILKLASINNSEVYWANRIKFDKAYLGDGPMSHQLITSKTGKIDLMSRGGIIYFNFEDDVLVLGDERANFTWGAGASYGNIGVEIDDFICPTENGNQNENEKNMSLYSNKELFLISDKNWKEVLPWVSAAVWTEGNETIKKYPFLIWHEEEGGYGFTLPQSSSSIAPSYNLAYSVNGKSLVRFYLEGKSREEFLKQDLDVASIGEDYVDVVLEDKEKEHFESFGYDIETVPVISQNKFQSEGKYSGEGYHTYQSMSEELNNLASSYSNIAKMHKIGKSVENRSILAMKISDNPDINENETKILIAGNHHAREIMTVEVPMFMINYLLKSYDSDENIKKIVDNYELWFVPMVNPDGHVIVENGDIWWRKNARDNNGDGLINDNDGVDLNRNYGFTWGYDDVGSSPNPYSAGYRGTAAFSEPETQTIRNLMLQNDFTYAIDYHSYAGVILYPWGHINEPAPDDSYFFDLSKEFRKVLTDYGSGQISQIMYFSNGDSIDWEYGEQNEKNKVFAFGIELASQSGFNPPVGEINPTCEKQMILLLNLTGYPLEYSSTKNIDIDSDIYFMQQYSPSKLTIIGNTSQEIDNLLIAAPELGAGLSASKIQRREPKDYLSYWNNYTSVVYVEDNYELALLASTYASLINSPLIIQNSENDISSVFNGKDLICVGSVARSCNEQYNLEELQQKYLEKTNTTKLMLVNPDDLDISATDTLHPEKTTGSISEIYSKTSLAAPILASAKHELMIFDNSKNANNIDGFVEDTFWANYPEQISSCSYGESCASGFSNNPVDMPGARNELSVSFKGQADVFIDSVVYPTFQLGQEGNFSIRIKNNGFDKANDVFVSVYLINESSSPGGGGGGGGGGGSPYSSYSGEFILIGSSILESLDVDEIKQAEIRYTFYETGIKTIWINVSTSSNESNILNNARTEGVLVAGPSPDIEVVPNIPKFLMLNSDNNISINVSNIGSLNSKSVDVSLYRRTWNSGGEQRILIGTENIPSLAAGEKNIIDFSIVPEEEGYYDFYAEAVTSNDENLKNNDFYFSVLAAAGEPRIFNNFDIPRVILVNESTTINLTLFNEGFETAKNMEVEFYIEEDRGSALVRMLVEKKSVGDLAGRESKQTSFNHVFDRVGYVNLFIILNISYEYNGEKSFESWYATNVKFPGPDVVGYIYDVNNVELGQETSATIRIYNEGNSIAENVTYSLYDNNILVKRENIGVLAGLEMLGAVHEKEVTIFWTPSSIGEHNLLFSVECDNELNTENNNQSTFIYIYHMKDVIFEIINESGGNVNRFLGIGPGGRNPEIFYEISNPTSLRIPDISSDIWIVDSVNLSEQFNHAFAIFKNSALHDRMFTRSKTYEKAGSEGDKRLYKIYANEVYWNYNQADVSFYYTDYREIVSDPSRLVLYYCQNWDFGSESCLSGWQETPWVNRYLEGTRLQLSSSVYSGAEAFAVGEQIVGNYSTEFREGESFFGIDKRYRVKIYDEITPSYGTSHYQISIPGFFYNCDTANVEVYFNDNLQGTRAVNCYNTLTGKVNINLGEYIYSNVKNITLKFDASMIFYNSSRIIRLFKDGTEYSFGSDASSGISVIPVNSFGSKDQSSFFFENRGYNYLVASAESSVPPDLTVYVNGAVVGELDISNSNGKKGRGFLINESGDINISLKSKNPGRIYLADAKMKTNFDDYYLTIAASPDAIPMSSGFEETDFRRYGSVDGDNEGELAVGRIMGITLSDVSSYMARVLFYDSLNKEKNVVMIMRGDPRGNPIRQGIPQRTKGQNFCKAYYDMECTDLFNRYSPLFEESIVCNESVGYSYVECDTNLQIMREGMNRSTLVVYADHGAPSGWHGVRTDSLWNLPPEFAYSFACSTCDYGYNHNPADLFCTNMIRRGATGYIGAVREMYGHHFLPEFLDEVLIDNRSVGYAFKIGKNTEARYDWGFKNLEWSEGIIDLYGANDILVGDPTFDGRIGK